MGQFRVLLSRAKQAITQNGGWAAYTQGVEEAGTGLAIGVGLLSSAIAASAALEAEHPPLEAAAIALTAPPVGVATGFTLGAGGRLAVNIAVKHPSLAACGIGFACAVGAAHYAKQNAQQSHEAGI